MAERVGLLGGTFDPVHNGHLSIFHSFLNSGLIDELWILLTPDPPHKPDKKHLEYSHRLTMLQLAVSKLSSVSVSAIENELPKPSYTIQTVRALKKQFTDKIFHYCIGGDSLTSFHLWKDYDQLLREINLLVAKRPDFDYSGVSDEILNHSTLVDHIPNAISSTEIRNKIKAGNSISDLVPKPVEVYILEQGLYKQ